MKGKLGNRNLKLIQSRDEIKNNPSEIGKAVFDILSKPQETQTVGETLEAMTPKYFEGLKEALEDNRNKFDPPFYVIVLRKKEPWALNVLRQWFVARQTRPNPRILRQDFPNHDHDVWQADPITGQCDLQWSLPTAQDASVIVKNKHLYHEDLVKWVMAFNEGKLN